MLLDSEIARIKVELGYNLMGDGAGPWIDTVAVFEQVIQPYLGAGSATTSSTSVTPSSPVAPASITLADADGFASGARVVVDVDSRQETVTVQNLSGTSLTALFTKTHSGTYPVTVEGGEAIIREILVSIKDTKAQMAKAYGLGSLKRADEIEWYRAGTMSQFGVLGENLSYWRSELASALGLRPRWAEQRAAGATLSVY